MIINTLPYKMTEYNLVDRNLTLSKDIYSFSNVSKIINYEGIIVQDTMTIFDNMRSFFDSRTTTFTIDNTYYYKPEYLSLKIYGTTALWYVLLKLNFCKNHLDFNRSSITILDPKYLIDLQELIFNTKKDLIANKTNSLSSIEDLTIKSLF